MEIPNCWMVLLASTLVLIRYISINKYKKNIKIIKVSTVKPHFKTTPKRRPLH